MEHDINDEINALRQEINELRKRVIHLEEKAKPRFDPLGHVIELVVPDGIYPIGDYAYPVAVAMQIQKESDDGKR